MVIPDPSDRANTPPLGCVTLNSVILNVGLRLFFPRVIHKFLSSWGIAPTQLCLNRWRTLIATLILWSKLGNSELSVEQFNSLFTFKEDKKNSRWCYTSVRPRTRGSLVLDTPSSIKNGRIFFVLGEWQFHPTGVERNDVVPTFYHSLCKFYILFLLLLIHIYIFFIAKALLTSSFHHKL